MPQLAENFFRHEYGRLVSLLSCRVGVDHLEDIEDAVQSALMKALEVWQHAEPPENPSAWLFRVAYNNLMGVFRQRSGRRHLLESHMGAIADASDVSGDVDGLPAEGEDETLLRMLFLCCDEKIPVASQLVFALKVLCGFSISEIAVRLLTTEANVYKRFSRARQQLRKRPLSLEDLEINETAGRLPAVLKVLYLLFTEGYLSTHPDQAIREELCREALRLACIVASHTVGQSAGVYALIALMYLHLARMEARQSDSGGLLLLEEQHRETWDQELIFTGLSWLEKSAQGEVFTRYHAEAGIAAEHCMAPSLAETRWEKVVEYYELLDHIAPSALHRLNRAVAIAEWQGPEAGLLVLKGFEPPSWLTGSYFWAAVLADLHRRCGHLEKAADYREEALAQAPTEAIRALLRRRLQHSGL